MRRRRAAIGLVVGALIAVTSAPAVAVAGSAPAPGSPLACGAVHPGTSECTFVYGGSGAVTGWVVSPDGGEGAVSVHGPDGAALTQRSGTAEPRVTLSHFDAQALAPGAVLVCRLGGGSERVEAFGCGTSVDVTGQRLVGEVILTAVDVIERVEAIDDRRLSIGTARNHDGTRWLVTWDGGSPEMVPPPNVLDAARIVLEEGPRLYREYVSHNDAPCSDTGASAPASWGFVLSDPDCVMEVFLHDRAGVVPHDVGCGPACVPSGRGDVDIWLSPNLDTHLHANGFYLRDPFVDRAAIFRSVFAHELFHEIQVTALDPDGTRPDSELAWWGAFVEGQARWLQTIAAPALEDQPTSMWSAARGPSGVTANDHQFDPGLALCRRSYDAALLWGFLAAHNGGVPMVQRFLEELRGVSGDCTSQLGPALDRTLAASPGQHDRLADALEDFAVAAFTRDFHWAGADGIERDWGRHLLEPRRVPAGMPVASVGGFALAYVDLPETAGHRVAFRPGDSGWSASLLVRRADGSLDVRRVHAGEAFAVPADGDPVLSVVRTVASSGTYTVDIVT